MAAGAGTTLGRQPGGRGCELQFVSASLGWCTFIGAAAGSESVTLYRTDDGGRHWQLVSRTSVSAGRRPGALPFGGDKDIEFTNVDIGWGAFEAPVGTAPLYETEDGGATWVPRQVSPAPETGFGGNFAGQPVLEGRDGAVGYSVGGKEGARTRSCTRPPMVDCAGTL